MPNHQSQYAYLSLGSNMGDARGNIHQALGALADMLRLDQVSSLYWTEPQGLPDQPWFANCVARILMPSAMTPRELLALCAGIEDQLGRTRSLRWGPRTLDIDILLMDGVCLESDVLHIPHPRLCERAFVLVPLMELDPDVLIHGCKPAYWLSRLDYSVDKDQIRQPCHLPR